MVSQQVLPSRVRRLLRQVRGHKRNVRTEKRAARDKMAEVERICNELGIRYIRRRRHEDGEADRQGHNKG